MLLIIIALLVILDIFILMTGTAVPESQLQAEPIITQKLRKNVHFIIMSSLM